MAPGKVSQFRRKKNNRYIKQRRGTKQISNGPNDVSREAPIVLNDIVAVPNVEPEVSVPIRQKAEVSVTAPNIEPEVSVTAPNVESVPIRQKAKAVWKVDDRPTFYLDESNKSRPLRAGGVLPYLFRNGIPYLLMIKCNERYEDFGGKTSLEDKSIKETIAREAWEESNQIISLEYARQKIKGHGIYFPKGKYLVYLIEAERDYDVESFGTEEIFENIPRTVEWVPVSSIHKDFNLHPRLHDNRFFEALLFLQLDCITV